MLLLLYWFVSLMSEFDLYAGSVTVSLDPHDLDLHSSVVLQVLQFLGSVIVSVYNRNNSWGYDKQHKLIHFNIRTHQFCKPLDGLKPTLPWAGLSVQLRYKTCVTLNKPAFRACCFTTALSGSYMWKWCLRINGARPHSKGFCITSFSMLNMYFKYTLRYTMGVDLLWWFEHPFHMVIGHCVFGHWVKSFRHSCWNDDSV